MSFANDIKKFAEKAQKSQDRIVLELVVDLNRLVIMKTPVDTGNARGGWTASIGSPVLSTGSIDKTGSKTIAKTNRVAQDAPGKVYYLTNSVEYISYLEYGTSKMSPKGMARLSVAEVKQKVRSYVNGN